MEYINEVTINEAVVHILDNNSDEPILNEYKLDLTEEIYKFLYRHVQRCLKDEELKYAVFKREGSIVRDIAWDFLSGHSDFLEVSKELSRKMFMLMKSKGGICSCDLMIISISTEYGPLLGILKMDYIKNYVHTVEFVDNKVEINIVPQYTGLPVSSGRIQKCAFIKPMSEENSFDLMVIDKQTKNKNSEEYGSNYFTQDYLGCSLIDNERDMTKSFITSAEKWTRTNLKENAEAQEAVRSTLKKELMEKDEVDVKEVAENLFGSDTVVKESFINYIGEEAGVDKVAVDKAWLEKKFKRIRLKIDKDIDLYINEEAYHDNSKFEIIRNGDGTINMVIKQVSNYVEK